MYLHLFLYFFLNKNPGWVTDDNCCYEDFLKDYYVGVPPVGRPYAGATKLELDMCFISACCHTLIFVVVIIAL